MTVARDLQRTAIAIRYVPKRGMIVAARYVKSEAQIYGGGRTISRRGRGRRPIRLRARDEIREGAGETTCRVQGVPVGPWVWATDGTGPHVIGRRKYRGKRSVHLELGGGWVTGPIRHRGARGRGAWNHVADAAERNVPRIFDVELAGTL